MTRASLDKTLALLLPDESTIDRWYILYDIKQLRVDWARTVEAIGNNKMTRGFFERDDENSFIVAALNVAPKPSGKQWNVPTVNNSVAQRGYGPLLYDIAMFYEGGLAPDRSMVSQSARAVWDYYAMKRNDVKKKRFDDIDVPRTPPKIDDTFINDQDAEDGPLNHAYFIDHVPPVVNSLVKNHEIFSREFLVPKKISLGFCAMTFFRSRYKND